MDTESAPSRVQEIADPSPLADTPMPAEWLSDDEVRLLERVLRGQPPLMLTAEHEQRLIAGGYLAWQEDRLLPTRHAVAALEELMGNRRASPKRAGPRNGKLRK